MLVGIAGSGKSTLANKLEGKVFSSDAIRAELYGDESVQTNPSKVFSILHQRIFDHLRAGESDAIYDATNLSKARRQDFVRRVKQEFPDCECICYKMEIPVEECHRRNSLRARRVPDEVIDRQARQLEWPTYDEGWDKIYSSSQLWFIDQ